MEERSHLEDADQDDNLERRRGSRAFSDKLQGRSHMGKTNSRQFPAKCVADFNRKLYLKSEYDLMSCALISGKELSTKLWL